MSSLNQQNPRLTVAILEALKVLQGHEKSCHKHILSYIETNNKQALLSRIKKILYLDCL